MLKIFISVGEHSGDLLGARLMKSLKDELDAGHNIDFQGVGGPLMEREGFKSIFNFSLLSIMGIKDILIISTPKDIDNYKELLGTGSKYGISFRYMIQPSPDGLAQAFVLGEKFIGDDNIALVLGDNIFYGNNLPSKLRASAKKVEEESKAIVFGYYVNDPHRTTPYL